MNDPTEQLKIALQQSDVGIAFAWDQRELNSIELQSRHLQRGHLYCFRSVSEQPLHALEIKRNDLPVWPPTLLSKSTFFTRVLDKLYVPSPRERLTTIAVFDACASAYESLIHIERNLLNITRLLNLIVARERNQGRPLRIIDFGCGTGLSIRAVAAHPDVQRVSLCGLDGSRRMRSMAENRGLPLVTGTEAQLYDGILASYVLHGALGDQDIKWIATSLTNRGIFAGNWLHGQDSVMKQFHVALGQVRRGKGKILRDESLWPSDPIVTFEVNET